MELQSGYDWSTGFVTFEGSAINGKNWETGMSLATIPRLRERDDRFPLPRQQIADDRRPLHCGWLQPEECSTATDSDGTTPLPTSGYGLVDLFASYAYNDLVSGNPTVNNLLNREYTQFLNIEPNPGLTVKAGITIRFAER